MFADSLVLMKQLGTSSTITSALSKAPDNKLGTLHSSLFGEEFNAHDELEDVKTLSKVLF